MHRGISNIEPPHLVVRGEEARPAETGEGRGENERQDHEADGPGQAEVTFIDITDKTCHSPLMPISAWVTSTRAAGSILILI